MVGAAISRWGADLRAGDWLHPGTIVRYARVLLIINMVLATWATMALQQSRPNDESAAADFVSFYAAGHLALQGRAAAAYDKVEHHRAEDDVVGPGHVYQFFFYPPPYLALCAALATLPYYLAFAVFQAVTFGFFLLAIRRVASTRALATWLMPVLAFTPLFWTVGLGQNAFLTAGLLAFATLSIDRRPWLAGLLFGALCFKPHMGLLVPVALVAGGRWRSFAAAGGTVVFLVAGSWLLFGSETWVAYIDSFVGSGQVYSSGRIAFAGMVSPFGAARLAGLPATAALVVQGITTLFVAVVVAWVWRHSRSQAVRGATLLAGTMVALPVVLLYDQMITLVAIAWLMHEVKTSGALPWEKSVLASAYLLPLLAFPLGLIWDLPLAPLPAFLLLAICIARTWDGAEERLTSARRAMERTLSASTI